MVSTQSKILKSGYLIAENKQDNLKYFLRYNPSSTRKSQTYRCYVLKSKGRKKINLITIQEIGELYKQNKVTLVNNGIKLNITYIPARMKVEVFKLPTFK